MKQLIKQLKKESKFIISSIGLGRDKGRNIGLDIGHGAFRAVRIDTSGNKISVRDVVVRDLSRLKDLNKDMHIEPDEWIFVNFKSENIVIRRTSIPVMPKEEIGQALRWQLKDYVQFDIDVASIKFDILGQKQDESGAKRLDLLAVIYREEDIEKKVNELRAMGLNVQGVFPSELALAEYAKIFDIISPDGNVAIVDIGSIRTNISIIENKRISLSRDIAIGGDDITDAMTGKVVSDKGKIEFTREEAERIKCEQGIPHDVRIMSLMRPVLERLATEIERSLTYCERIFQCRKLDKVLLAGNGARLKGLKEFLSREIGVEVIDVLPENACAIGLSLISNSHLNMLPEKFSAQRKAVLKRLSLRMVIMILSVILLLSYGYLSIKVTFLKNETRVMSSHLNNIKEVRPIKERVTELRNAVNKISQEAIYAATIMKELSYIIPSYVILNNMEIDEAKPNVNISGIILKGDRLTYFMEKIEDSGLFRDVILKISKKVESEDYSDNTLSFELVFDRGE